MLSPLLIWNKIGRVVTLIANDMGISSEKALSFFTDLARIG